MPENSTLNVRIDVEIEDEQPEPYCHCSTCDEAIETSAEAYSNRFDFEVRCSDCDRQYVSERESEDETRDFDVNYRDYDSDKYIFKNKKNLKTSIMQSPRAFGIELECQGESYRTINRIIENLDSRIGVSTDGSINGDKGFEMQFPLINGLQGEKMVFDTCKILNQNNTKVDDSCGYHVHLQSKRDEQNYHFIQRLMFVYMVFEDVIISFLPKSRKNNHFCKSLRNYIQLDHVLRAKNRDILEELWYKSYNKRERQRRKGYKYDEARYFGFNFHCYFGKGKHIEVRHHNGTTNATKILHWANLHCLLLDFVKREVDFNSNINTWVMKQEMLDIFDSVFDGKKDIEQKANYLFNLIGISQEGREYFISRQNSLTK